MFGWKLDASSRFMLRQLFDQRIIQTLDRTIIGSKNGNLILYAKWTKKLSGSMNIQLYSYGSRTLTRSPEKKLSNMDYRILDLGRAQLQRKALFIIDIRVQVMVFPQIQIVDNMIDWNAAVQIICRHLPL